MGTSVPLTSLVLVLNGRDMDVTAGVPATIVNHEVQ